MKKLTIFTPTYNRAYILPQCYESLKNQTCKDFIWLIVDDGSTDNTKIVVDSFINENKIEIKYIKQENGGKYKAVNTAINNCTTEFFSFVDSDDYYKSETVDTFLKYFEKYKKIAGIIGRRCNKSGELVGSKNKYNDGEINFSKLISKQGYYGDTCRAYKTEILKTVLYPEIDEKFIPENVMLGKIDEKYDVVFLNKALSVSEYLEDGYTQSYKILLKKNPKGYMLSLQQIVESKMSLMYRLKAMLSYITWGKRQGFIKKYQVLNKKAKMLYIVCLPIANMFLLLGIPKWHNEKKGIINKLSIWLGVIKNFLLTFNGCKANILSNEETVDIILQEHLSLIRIGDGEFNIMAGKDIDYQKASIQLIKEMKSMMKEFEDNNTKCKYLLCVPKFFIQCNGIKLANKRVWISSWSFARNEFKKHYNPNIAYGNAFLFARGNKDVYEKIWPKGQYDNCIFLHNDQSFADDFEKVYGIKTYFIKVPEKNAYENIEELYDSVNEVLNSLDIKHTIVLISAGPAAKILAMRLSNKVITIDTGHCWDKPLEGVRNE